MSSFLDKTDALAAMIRTLPAVGEDAVIVDRQKNLNVEISKNVAKAKGGVVTILWAGGKNNNLSSKKLQLENRYFVRVYAKPILRDEGDTAVDDLVEAIAVAMHGWHEDPDSPLRRPQRLGYGMRQVNRFFLARRKKKITGRSRIRKLPIKSGCMQRTG